MGNRKRIVTGSTKGGRCLIPAFVICSVLLLITCSSVSAEEFPAHYTSLKTRLAQGWNTWKTRSVLAHVKLPEAPMPRLKDHGN
jgi:hypothetical protein